MDASENKRSIAVVTGASGGFGKEFVRLLLEEDTVDEIWAVARNQAVHVIASIRKRMKGNMGFIKRFLYRHL